MSHHYHVLFLERPARGHVENHAVLHVVNDFAVQLLDFPLPREALVDSQPSERLREAVEPIVQHVVIVDKFEQVALFKLRKHCRR